MPDCLGTSEANKGALPASDSMAKAIPCVAGRNGKCCFMPLALAPGNRRGSRAPSQVGSLLVLNGLARIPDTLCC